MFTPNLVCVTCGDPIPVSDNPLSNRNRKYCKPRCNTDAWRVNNLARSKAFQKASYQRQLSWVTYQHINALGEIIYVGKTNSIRSTTSRHKIKSKWYGDIAATMVQPWKNEAAASVAEAWLIAVHKPVNNIYGLETSTRRKGNC